MFRVSSPTNISVNPMDDDDIQRLLSTAEKRNISNVEVLLEEENIGPSKKTKISERPKGVSDISSFFKIVKK